MLSAEFTIHGWIFTSGGGEARERAAMRGVHHGSALSVDGAWGLSTLDGASREVGGRCASPLRSRHLAFARKGLSFSFEAASITPSTLFCSPQRPI